ncbi:MAG TPA: site-2 protease family protein, partial [Micropepsaceae bacterium]|nr:site-2 protease family protein [Micropepsaceae bacterium]
MEGLGIVGDFISGGATYILPFLFVLTIVVFVHELGHFLMGRFFNTKIETFSIGFGREMFGFNDRHGTRWKFSWVPLGGYVKFWGDETAASTPDIDALESVKNDPERSRCFHFKPVHQRALIVAAGPFA